MNKGHHYHHRGTTFFLRICWTTYGYSGMILTELGAVLLLLNIGQTVLLTGIVMRATSPRISRKHRQVIPEGDAKGGY